MYQDLTIRQSIEYLVYKRIDPKSGFLKTFDEKWLMKRTSAH